MDYLLEHGAYVDAEDVIKLICIIIIDKCALYACSQLNGQVSCYPVGRVTWKL